jgi:predicted Rossmann fold nucleotide-binding protein DprA/Smf involved in DNA uptake
MILNGQVTAFRVGGPGFPQTLLAGFASDAPSEIWAAGHLALLDHPKTGLFCSSQCPGSIILKTFDAITRMRDEGQVLIGGFHSVMEWECLGILLRGRQPVIWVPARTIVGMHLKPKLVPAFNAGRLLILSPFPPKDKRIAVALAEARNRFVGALADRVFVPHGAPGGKTAALAHQLLSQGKEVYTIDDQFNRELIFMGAIPVANECVGPNGVVRSVKAEKRGTTLCRRLRTRSSKSSRN